MLAPVLKRALGGRSRNGPRLAVPANTSICQGFIVHRVLSQPEPRLIRTALRGDYFTDENADAAETREGRAYIILGAHSVQAPCPARVGGRGQQGRQMSGPSSGLSPGQGTATTGPGHSHGQGGLPAAPNPSIPAPFWGTRSPRRPAPCWQGFPTPHWPQPTAAATTRPASAPGDQRASHASSPAQLLRTATLLPSLSR